MPVYRLAARNARCASPGCRCRDRARYYPSDLDDARSRLCWRGRKLLVIRLLDAFGSGYDGGPLAAWIKAFAGSSDHWRA